MTKEVRGGSMNLLFPVHIYYTVLLSTCNWISLDGHRQTHEKENQMIESRPNFSSKSQNDHISARLPLHRSIIQIAARAPRQQSPRLISATQADYKAGRSRRHACLSRSSTQVNKIRSFRARLTRHGSA